MVATPKIGNKIVLTALVVLALVGGAYSLGLSTANSFRATKCNENYRLINLELNCGQRYVLEKHEYTVVRNELEEYFEREKSAGHVKRYATYFRDLENGPIFSINEREHFVPASLLKLPLMLTFFHIAEERVEILDEELYFEWVTEPTLNPHYPPSVSLVAGNRYSIREIVRMMIVYSDNASYDVLIEYLRNLQPNGDAYLDTMREIGLIEPMGNLDATLTVKQYASILRALYNGSFLSLEYSELALSYLIESDFSKGLVAGVPKHVPVAHKFGERFVDETNQKILHDCGIVYYPKNPYLLCVMVEGNEFPELEKVISTVSNVVYDEVYSRRI